MLIIVVELDDAAAADPPDWTITVVPELLRWRRHMQLTTPMQHNKTTTEPTATTATFHVSNGQVPSLQVQ